MCNGRPNHDDPRMSLHGTKETITVPSINVCFEGLELKLMSAILEVYNVVHGGATQFYMTGSVRVIGYHSHPAVSPFLFSKQYSPIKDLNTLPV